MVYGIDLSNQKNSKLTVIKNDGSGLAKMITQSSLRK